MPPGFSLLDAALVSAPIFLTLLGLIRGAPVELASGLGCMAGAAAAWLVGSIPMIHGLGDPMAPLLALLGGVVTWGVVCRISHHFRFDTRWIDLGRIFDSFVGGLMGGIRGVALVSAGCLSYAMILVPFGLANPMRTVAYPVFLAVGSQATSVVIATAEPVMAKFVATGAGQSLATVPLPFTALQLAAPQLAAPQLAAPQLAAVQAPSTVNGTGLQALMHAIAPSAAAAPVLPVPLYHPVVPARGIPAGLMETQHNILNPFGLSRRRH